MVLNEIREEASEVVFEMAKVFGACSFISVLVKSETDHLVKISPVIL